MICNEHFTFIHLHKTGGQSLNKLISTALPDSEEIGYHYPIAYRPEKYSGTPIVGVVRNPWDWYLSWYVFNRTGKAKNKLFNLVSRGSQADFKTTITNLINFGDSSVLSHQIRSCYTEMLPKKFGNKRDVNFTKSCVSSMVSNEKGYYSLLFDRMFGEDSSLHMISSFENFEDSFCNIMEKLSIEEAKSMKLALSLMTKKNSTRHSHYSHYYDDELAELVSKKEASIINKFNYQFEQQANDEEIPVIPIPQQRPFSKVFSSQENFYKVGLIPDMEELIYLVNGITEEEWGISDRGHHYIVHNKTHSVTLLYDDISHTMPEENEIYPRFKDVLRPVLDHILNLYGDEDKGGMILRIVLARLMPKEQITLHKDNGFSLMNCNRIHVPIVTDDKVAFNVGGEIKNLKVGEIWEINNANYHGVDNDSDQARVHMIIDWTVKNTLHAEKPANWSERHKDKHNH